MWLWSTCSHNAVPGKIHGWMTARGPSCRSGRTSRCLPCADQLVGLGLPRGACTMFVLNARREVRLLGRRRRRAGGAGRRSRPARAASEHLPARPSPLTASARHHRVRAARHRGARPPPRHLRAAQLGRGDHLHRLGDLLRRLHRGDADLERLERLAILYPSSPLRDGRGLSRSGRSLPHRSERASDGPRLAGRRPSPDLPPISGGRRVLRELSWRSSSTADFSLAGHRRPCPDSLRGRGSRLEHVGMCRLAHVAEQPRLERGDAR